MRVTIHRLFAAALVATTPLIVMEAARGAAPVPAAPKSKSENAMAAALAEIKVKIRATLRPKDVNSWSSVPSKMSCSERLGPLSISPLEEVDDEAIFIGLWIGIVNSFSECSIK